MKQKYQNTIEKRQNKEKELVLKQLKKTPIIQVACNQAGVSRPSYYRWRNEDNEFKKATEEAMKEGESFINDMSESQVLSLIKDKNWQAVQFWLKFHHPTYANKIEVNANIKQSDEKLTPEQEKIVRKALKLISGSEQESSDKNNDKVTKKSN